jgi:hypothetical protein
MQLGWICMLILTIGTILNVAAGWIIALRVPAGITACIGQTMHLVVILILTFTRFSKGSKACADGMFLGVYVNNPVILADGVFLKRVVITLWACGWFHCFLLCSGNINKPK